LNPNHTLDPHSYKSDLQIRKRDPPTIEHKHNKTQWNILRNTAERRKEDHQAKKSFKTLKKGGILLKQSPPKRNSNKIFGRRGNPWCVAVIGEGGSRCRTKETKIIRKTK